jgi:hypothetical protein
MHHVGKQGRRHYHPASIRASRVFSNKWAPAIQIRNLIVPVGSSYFFSQNNNYFWQVLKFKLQFLRVLLLFKPFLHYSIQKGPGYVDWDSNLCQACFSQLVLKHTPGHTPNDWPTIIICSVPLTSFLSWTSVLFVPHYFLEPPLSPGPLSSAYLIKSLPSLIYILDFPIIYCTLPSTSFLS